MQADASFRIRPLLLVIAMAAMLLGSGCAEIGGKPIVVSYNSIHPQGTATVKRGTIGLRIEDDRASKAFFRITAPLDSLDIPDQGDPKFPRISLSKTPIEIVEDGFKSALIEAGYSIREDAPVVVEVHMKEFLYQHTTHFLMGRMDGTTTISLQVVVKNATQTLASKEITETSKRDSTFGYPNSELLGTLFSQHLSRAIDRVVEDHDIVDAVAKGQTMPVAVVFTPAQPPTVEPVAARPTSFQVWQPIGRQQVWVLAVGVGQYKSQTVPELPFARADAERVRDWFLRTDGVHLPAANIHVLCDEQATRENLLEQIDWLRKQAMPEDAVFIYFAGHGAPELAADGSSVNAKYLVLHDTDPERLFATGFALDDLTRKLDAVDARVQVVILEACYTGPVGQEILKKTPTADLEIRPRLIQEMGEKGGRVILSASTGRQMAIGSDELKGMLFTHYLLESWGNGNKKLLGDCFDQVREDVRRAAKQLGSSQEPTKFGDENIDLILSK